MQKRTCQQTVANAERKTNCGDKLITDIMSQYIKTQRKNTIAVCEATVKHLNAFAGHQVRIGEIDEHFVCRFVNYLIDVKGLATSSIRTYLQKLHALVETSIRLKYSTINPLQRLGRFVPSGPRVSRTHLEQDELRCLIGTPCRNTQIKIAFFFACFTGLRLSDIETLQWNHIVHTSDGWMIVKRQVKTGNFVRIPIEDEVYGMLRQHCSANKVCVFCLPSRTTISKILNEWCSKAGIGKHVTFHVSRHTFASILINGQVELLTVSELCGHRSIETTKIYTHLNDSTRRNAIKTIYDYIFFDCRKRKNSQLTKRQKKSFNELII